MVAGPGGAAVMLGRRQNEEGMSEVTPEVQTGVLGAAGEEKQELSNGYCLSRVSLPHISLPGALWRGPILPSSLHLASS